MHIPRKTWAILTAITLAVISSIVCAWGYLETEPFGFSRWVSCEEREQRLFVVQTAEKYLGFREDNGSHKAIVDQYNRFQPLARDYEVTYNDSWCAAYVSAVAIACEVTDRIPTECSCGQQIKLLQTIGCWQEKDSYFPLPGDLIYYDWDAPFAFDDCTGWPDHVGIVVGTFGPMIKVIEGNLSDSVAYRYIPVNNPRIRGYGIPDYR